MSYFEGTLELKSPLSKECWDKLADVELENTERIWFTTPSKKRVEYIKADVLEQIRQEIEESITDYILDEEDTNTAIRMEDVMTKVFEIIDKYTKGDSTE